MIFSAAIIAALGWWVELSVAHRYPAFRRLASSTLLVNALFSLTIAWSLSILFGATGVTVLMAALGTATLSSVSYRCWAAAEAAARTVRIAKAKLYTVGQPALPQAAQQPAPQIPPSRCAMVVRQ
jgi:hypothetical protein